MRLETEAVDPSTARQFSSKRSLSRTLGTVCDNDGGHRGLKYNLRVTFSVCNHAIKPICDRFFPNILFIKGGGHLTQSKWVITYCHHPLLDGTHPASTRFLNLSSTTTSTQFNLQMQFLFGNILCTKANLKGFEWSHKNSTISLPIRNDMLGFGKEGFS